MQHVLTLTGTMKPGSLGAGHIDTARVAVRAAGVTICRIEDLAPGRASDIHIDGLPQSAIIETVREALAGLPVDVNVQRPDLRRKRLLIADMDSTIITTETLDDLADLAGLGAEIAPVTARAMRGEIDFDRALRDRVLLFAGQPVSLLDRLLRERITITEGAVALVRTMKANHAFTALVSGGFVFVTGVIARKLGFDTHRGNTLLVAGGRLTGAVGEPVLGALSKLEILRAFCAERGLGVEQAIAVGDGANDIPMLKEAGCGVAFRGKPAAARAARFRIDHGDLTALLYLQGYRESEIVNR